MSVVLYIAAVCVGYLLGAIPCGVIITRVFYGRDVRTVGSGKTGTTNVMRAAGKKAAAAALVLDLGKGALAVFLASIIAGNYNIYLAEALGGAAAIVGHTWSVFLRFKGGRGVATFVGCLLVMYWPAGVIGGAFILGLAFKSHYMSLGSITGAVVAFIYMLIFYVLQIDFLLPPPPLELVIFTMAGAIFIYIMHHDNIKRLVTGTERTFREKPAR